MRIGDALRRLIDGPTDDEISAESLRHGGPSYPIPPLSTTMPTATTYGPAAVDLPSYELHDKTPEQIAADLDGLAARQELRSDVDTEPGRINPETAAIVEAAGSHVPPIGAPYDIPEGAPMTDHTHALDDDPEPESYRPSTPLGEQIARSMPVSAPPIRAFVDGGLIRPAAPDTPAAPDPENIRTDLGPSLRRATLPADSGIHTLPDPASDQRAVRLDCTLCKGTGYVTRTVNELLRESLAVVSEGDTIVRDFYDRLTTAAPHVAPLFPDDLVTAVQPDGDRPRTAGAAQRDRLLQALVALSEMYDPGNVASMERLETALRAFGRAHANFARPDGTIQGATLREYVAVGDTLLATLAADGGDQWRPEYATAWAEAYDYAAVTMLDEQRVTTLRMPRYPRPAA